MIMSCNVENNKEIFQDTAGDFSRKTDNMFLKEAVKDLSEEKTEFTEAEGEAQILKMYKDPLMKNRVLDFFSRQCGSMEVAEAILDNAVKFNVPPALAFSIARTESSFRIKAVNKNRVSIDRGLFQLNSSSFPKLTEKEFFDVHINTSKGVEYIRWCLDYGTNEVSALAMYNAGAGRVHGRGTPRSTLNYISKVLDSRKQYLIDFNLESKPEYRIDARGTKLVKDTTLLLD